jgi:hypothetical protein
MKISEKNSRISILNKTNILVILIFIIGVVSFLFRSSIGSFFWGLKCRSPIVWNNIKIKFPKGMVYKIYPESVWLFYWDEERNSISLQTIELQNKYKRDLLEFFKSKKIKILETSDIKFKNHESFTISYIDNKTKLYYKRIYVIPKNIYILYEGERTKYKDFKRIIDDIEFL